MAEFYKNIDKFCGCDGGAGTPPLRAVGVQYDEVSPLSESPVDLEFFKQHARIDFDTDDTLCQAYIDAATQELQDWALLSFGVRTMRLRAKSLPDNYRIMYGRVDTITTGNYTNTGDYLDKGGTDVDFEYTTLGIVNHAIKVAICRYSAGLYVFREQIVETKYNAQVGLDEAKNMVKPYMNIIL